MPNIVVSDNLNNVLVVFNDYSLDVGFEKSMWPKGNISSVHLMSNNEYVLVLIKGEREWRISYNGTSNTYQVDSINSETPTSNSDLYDKLVDLFI